jgi:SpoIID/LytB domain protein
MPKHDRRQTETERLPRPSQLGRLTALLAILAVGAVIAPPATMAETPGSSPSPSPSASPEAVPSSTPAAALATAVGPTTLGETVTFYGRGYGHGVGMSQYGARGRALAGQDAATILAHYYQGVTLEPIDPATRIRVLIMSRWAATEARPLVIYGRVAPWSIDGIGSVFPADARLRLFPTLETTGSASGAWRLVVDAADGTVLFDGQAPADLALRGTTEATRIQVWSKPTIYDRYRGSIRVLVQSATRLSVVNDVPLEEYLGGVVPVEMPSTWPAAALQAQAIAARSYAARRLRPGVSYFDVPDNSTSQIYRGIKAEKATTNAAIAATASTVMMAGTTIANALFHSIAGGATESNENVYTSASGRRTGRPVSYLRGASDRAEDNTAFDAKAPYATWLTRTYSRAQLSAMFAADRRTNVGDLIALDLRDRGISGRLVSVTLIGSAGSRTVSGEIFRAVFNARRPRSDPSLRSTLLDLAPIP